MKIVLKSFVVMSMLGGLTACVESETYMNDYRSNSGYVRTDAGDMHTGYNRAYRHHSSPGDPPAGEYTSNTSSTKHKWPDPATYENTNKSPTAPDVGYQTKPSQDSSTDGVSGASSSGAGYSSGKGHS